MARSKKTDPPPRPGSRFVFTYERLNSITATDKTAFYWDSEQNCKGLALRVTKNGVKSFILKRWFKEQGGAVTKQLGRFVKGSDDLKDEEFDRDPLAKYGKKSELTLTQARKLARAVSLKLESGHDMDSRTEEMTLQELFDDYVRKHALPKKKTGEVMIKDFDRNAGILKKKKLSQITPQMAENLHIELSKERGKYTANRTIQLLRAVFNKGIKWKVFSGQNPFADIELFEEKPRERFLSEAEITRLLLVLENEENRTIRDFILLSLSTGARKMNLCSMRWDDIRFDTSVWRIPETKSGSMVEIALTPRDLHILRERQKILLEEQGKIGEFVFPGEGETGHLMDPKRSWMRVRTEAELQNDKGEWATLHDLRRSLAAGLASANVNIALVKGALGHKDIKTTLMVYARTQKDAERDAKATLQNSWFIAAKKAKRKKTRRSV